MQVVFKYLGFETGSNSKGLDGKRIKFTKNSDFNLFNSSFKWLDKSSLYNTFRLVEGETIQDGRLQIFYNNHWRFVCSNYFKFVLSRDFFRSQTQTETFSFKLVRNRREHHMQEPRLPEWHVLLQHAREQLHASHENIFAKVQRHGKSPVRVSGQCVSRTGSKCLR
jgi:hypothetical protein